MLMLQAFSLALFIHALQKIHEYEKKHPPKPEPEIKWVERVKEEAGVS